MEIFVQSYLAHTVHGECRLSKSIARYFGMLQNYFNKLDDRVINFGFNLNNQILINFD